MASALKVVKTKKTVRYTYADYLEWEGPERYQLIDGEAYMMASPSVSHQAVVRELLLHFGNWLRDKTCQVFTTPLDVRLFPKKDRSDNTIFQPDLLVVCDSKKLSTKSVDGPPDLIIEIMSPSNTHSQLFYKFNYYLIAGVKEYWVVDPDEKIVNVYIYNKGRYFTTLYKDNDRIPVTTLPGLEIALEDVWARLNI